MNDRTQNDLGNEAKDVTKTPRRIALQPTKIKVLAIMKTKNSPEKCYPVVGHEEVMVFSNTAGGMVEATVEFADPDSGMCYVQYTGGNAEAWKWIHASNIVPPLILEKSSEAQVENATSDMQASVQGQISVVMRRTPVVASDETTPYENEHYPDIRAVRRLETSVAVLVFSKTQGCDVSAEVNMVTADRSRCRVTYTHEGEKQFKWVSVEKVQPPLLVIVRGEDK